MKTDRANQICATPVLDVPDESTQTTTSGEENIPTTTLNVGVDAGYVRSNALKGEGTRRFGVIAVKTLEDNSRCHAYVQTEVDDGDKRIVRFIEEGRDSPPASVTFLTDAGGDIKAATPLVGEANHRILDWFHLAMYFQIVLQTATPYKRWH